MIESCLKRKIVYKFLKKYKQKKWDTIIPSLLEIAVLYLYNTLKRAYYSEDDLLKIIKNLRSKNIINEINRNQEQQFTVQENFDTCNSFERKRFANRSFSKKTKNINELNIYTNYNIDNKIIHYYNKSSEATPIKRLINYSKKEVNEISNLDKKYHVLDKILKNENIKTIKNKNISNNNTINYNIIDIISPHRKENKYLTTNNSIFIENDNIDKEYIKVNKIPIAKKIKINKISAEDIKCSNKYSKEVIDEQNQKIGEINKKSLALKLNTLNEEELFLTNYNQKNINIENEIKNKNANNLYLSKQRNLHSKTANNSINNFFKTDFSFANRKKLINNENNKKLIKKMIIKEIRKKQFSNINKIFIDDDNKHKKTELMDDEIEIDNNENIDDINITSIQDNNDIVSKKLNLKLNKKQKSSTINYNSFNKNKNTKNQTFINDPNFFIKRSLHKRNIIIKQI